MAKVFYVVEKWRNFTKPGHTAVDQIVAIILGAVRSCKKTVYSIGLQIPSGWMYVTSGYWYDDATLVVRCIA